MHIPTPPAASTRAVLRPTLFTIATTLLLMQGPARSATDDTPLMVAIDLLSQGRGDEALPSLKRLAREDAAPAQYALGLVYLEGKWAPLDRVRGVAWLQIVRDGYPGIVSRPLALEKANALLAKVLPSLTGPELLAADRLATELVADWARRWPLDMVAARATLSEPRGDPPATATATNGLPLMAGCALDPQRRGCRLPKDFNATEHCSGSVAVTDTPATASPSKGAELQPLPPGTPNGSAVVRIYIDKTGFVCSSMIWKSSGNPYFDLTALESVSRSRFVPGLKGSSAVDSLFPVTMTQRNR